MARTFRRPRTAQPIAEMNVTNLVDLGFTLLIIFMIATPLIQQEQTIPVSLPVESVSAQQKPDPALRSESITVLPDGRVLLGDRPMIIRQLAVQLARFAAEPKPPVIHLRLDAKATAQQFVTVMDELKKHNLSKISFDTQVAR
ncbi:MAG: biopolymer transporter ExbD [Verrucomicrobia bacterium]|nr:biopolymer transporter ExbD [Verrucomicrobiota bacterium]